MKLGLSARCLELEEQETQNDGQHSSPTVGLVPNLEREIRSERKRMSINISNDKMIPEDISTDTDSIDETVAGQEEIYLEKTEEKLRAILISEDAPTYVQQEPACAD